MEQELFEPIKEYFEGFSYTCDGEVNDIDLYMEKDGQSVAVELKVTLDFKAIQQAALRQKVADVVFIGIFRPKDMMSKSFQNKIYLLKRLGIGLIVVSKRTRTMEIVSEPMVSELSVYQMRNKGKKDSLSSEFQKRRVKNNTGGVHRTKLITNYREEALLVLDALCELGGESKGALVRDLSHVKKASNILRDNYYGWFEHVDRGIYKVRQEGYDALEEFEDTMKKLKQNEETREE